MTALACDEAPATALPAGSHVFADAEALAQAAARRVVGFLAAMPGERIALCLAGGSTPRRLYEWLAGPLAGQMPWRRLHLFWGDERMVPLADPRSNAGAALSALAAADIAPDQLHPVRTSGSAEEAAAAYAAELAAFHGSDRLDPARPLFALTLLGLGPDGHTASLFPGSAAADEIGRWAVAVPHAGQPPFVPRVTLTRPALASSGLVLFLAAGTEKRAALARIAAGASLPAGRVAASAPACEWYLDEAAAGETA